MKIGIIGGSGLERPDILEDGQEIVAGNKYGRLQALKRFGYIKNVPVTILSRHGNDHTFSPTEVNYHANILELKEDGCDYILATSACGSLREKIAPGHFILPDQFIDFTKHRDQATYYTTFHNGAEHKAMADPFDRFLRKKLQGACKDLGVKVHSCGTVVTIEGPRFSTRAESHMFRGWGADIINMTTATEAALANELDIPYAVIAMATDYDCWREEEEPVTWQMIKATMDQNTDNVLKVLVRAIEMIGESHDETI